MEQLNIISALQSQIARNKNYIRTLQSEVNTYKHNIKLWDEANVELLEKACVVGYREANKQLKPLVKSQIVLKKLLKNTIEDIRWKKVNIKEG